MPPNTIIKDDHRLTVSGEPERVVEIDARGELSDRWINVLRARYENILPAIDVLRHGELFIERVRCEANNAPLPDHVREMADVLPSFEDLLRDRGVEIERGEYSLSILPWTDDEGWTQFAVDLGHFPKEGEPELMAQLGGDWEIRIAISMLREAIKMIGKQ